MKSIFTIILTLIFTSTSFGQVPEKSKVIAGAERAFEKASKTHTTAAPGCAVGVSLAGESVFEKAFGLAEMEHNIPNTPNTIFESGSVAKQFVAAALVLLEQDGKLDLDDDARKYLPELPDYGSKITIRHLLNHTAGVRDWGSVMALTGIGRGDRVISQDVAIDVVFRQKALDFKPGDEHSYSNSGYQLATLIAERVSKKKFPDFIAERFFKPLGMKNSSWRDDYQRVVPGRAQAYSRQGPDGPWKLNMPIMSVYGNGGMLTTVGEWLKWNAMLDSRSMGASLVDALETQGVLNDGRKIEYALGVVVSKNRGMREVSHGGATAGYQTFLARYPDQKVSVAVLCNGQNLPAGRLAALVTDEIFGPSPESAQPNAGPAMTEGELQKYAGMYRNERTHAPQRVWFEKGRLLLNARPMVPLGNDKFRYGPMIVTINLGPDGNPTSAQSDEDGEIMRLIPEIEWKPTAVDLAAIAGKWYSDEADATFLAVVEGENAFLTQRPNNKYPLRPVYKDHFAGPGGMVVWLSRDSEGKITTLHIGGGRMRNMPFVKN